MKPTSELLEKSRAILYEVQDAPGEGFSECYFVKVIICHNYKLEQTMDPIILKPECLNNTDHQDTHPVHLTIQRLVLQYEPY